ncbi:MAG: hypothetical protein ABIQ95_07830 [Bdellovibrionia bacterium]
MKQIITGAEVIQVIESLGELAWNRMSTIDMTDLRTIVRSMKIHGRDNFRTEPSFTSWRYKNPNPRIEQLIVEAVNTFRGKVEWVIHVKETGNRNWLIETRRCRETREAKEFDLSKFPTTESYLESIDPQFGMTAAEDVPNLAEHIKNYVQKRLKD